MKPPTALFYIGNSMRRVFREGDQIIWETIEFSDWRRGDLAVYHSGNAERVVHRVLEVRTWDLRTMGDNNAVPDPDPVLPGQLLGRVTCRVRGGRSCRMRNGRSGMLVFYRQRLERKLCRWANPWGKWYLRRTPDCLRIRNFQTVRFGAATHYYWHGILIGTETNDICRYRRAWFKLFFLLERPDKASSD